MDVDEERNDQRKSEIVGDFPPHARDVLIGNVLCKTLKWQVSHEPAQAFSDEAFHVVHNTVELKRHFIVER